MGLQLSITPYGGGGFRVAGRGHCSGLLCHESQEAADNSDLLWKSCDLVQARFVMDDPLWLSQMPRDIAVQAVAQLLCSEPDLAMMLHH